MALELPFGPHVHAQGTRFTAYAPRAERCALRLYGPSGVAAHPMQRASADGVFAVDLPGVGVGAEYRFEVDGVELTDPYARFLPHGVHGPARVESREFPWRHAPLGWTCDLSIYELHVGTFTPEGTYRAAAERLPHIAALGVTAIELMPLAAFAGARGWGYDGVALFAPHAPYGTRDELAAFVDAAHGLGLRVLLDVVYNHFGPDGNYLRAFDRAAFHSNRGSPWGESPDFGNPRLREYVLANVRYWLGELRFDGLRLDATEWIHDESTPHVLEAIAAEAHALEPSRIVIAEDERNEPRLMTDLGLDGVWADDFHHQVHVALTGEKDGYYAAFDGSAAEIARTIEQGWSYSGEFYAPKGYVRGSSAEALHARALVYCIQNHDQIGNRAVGERLPAIDSAAGLEAFLAASFLLLTLPMTPLLFMGDEWAATSPFLYFTDHEPELGRRVAEGRRAEFVRFVRFADEAMAARLPDPQALETFTRSRLDWSEIDRPPHARVLALYRQLLALRRTDPVLRERSRASVRARAAADLLIVDRSAAGLARRIVVNLGASDAALPPDLVGQASLLLTSADAALPAGVMPRATAALYAMSPGSA